MQAARILLIGLGACTPYAPDLPAAPFLCDTTHPQCPDGYTCVDTGMGHECRNGQPVTDSGVVPDGSGTCSMGFSGVLATWTFTGQTGMQASTPAATTAPGVNAVSLTRSASLVVSSGTNSMSSSNWPTGALDIASYYTLAVTPPTGCALDLTAMAVDVKISGTGPASAAVATSADAFAQTVPVSTSTPSTPTLAVSGATGSVEVRIYGFAAGATTGTMRVQNELSVSGALR